MIITLVIKKEESKKNGESVKKTGKKIKGKKNWDLSQSPLPITHVLPLVLVDREKKGRYYINRILEKWEKDNEGKEISEKLKRKQGKENW